MSKTIWKFEFEIDDMVHINMPQDSEILSVQMQQDKPCLWALVNNKSETMTRVLKIFGTGHKIDNPSLLRHIGTIQELEGKLVWHVFEDFAAKHLKKEA